MPQSGLSPSLNHADVVREVAASSAPGLSTLAASWRRSLMHFRIDPGATTRPERIEAKALAERRDQSADMLRVAAPVLDRLGSAVLDAGSAVILSDADGLVIDERMRLPDVDVFEGAGLVSGADWSEAREGTNAIGTCLADRQPVEIRYDQHFRVRNISLACTAAPIEAQDGEIAGVIDVSSFRGDVNDMNARLIALTVQDAAMRISCALFHAAFPGARIVAVDDNVIGSPCLIAVDGDDLIAGCNRAACRALGLSRQEIKRRPPAIDLLGRGGSGGDISAAIRSEITRALRRAGGNVSAAARDLHIGRATLYRKIKALKLN